MRLSILLSLLMFACTPSGSGSVAGTNTTFTGTNPTGGTTGPGALPEGVSVEDGLVIRPHKIVTVELDIAAGIWVTCELDSDPTEVILVEIADEAEEHTFDLLGLAAGESYTCTAHAFGSSETLEFPVATDPVDDAPAFEVERNTSEEMSGVWTVANTGAGCFQNTDNQVIVADPEGRHRWVYNLPDDLVVDIDANLTPDGDMHIGGGWGILDEGQSNRGFFETVALNGEIVNQRDEPDFGLGFNHHSEAMDDGTFLSLTTSWMVDGAREWYGIGVERWDPDTDSLTYTWDTQGMVDAGILNWVPGEDNPYHANSVTWITDPQGDALYLSLYTAQEIWRIDRNTGMRTWRLGANSDFQLVDPSGSPLPDEEWFYVQHDPDWTTDGRVLLYDNGYTRPGPDYSRVSEYQLDFDNMTATLLWSWTEPDFYNPIIGDADWLDNGNVLVTKGFVVCWTPNSDDVSAIVEVNPDNDEVVWRMSWPDRGDATFRAERYDGCDLFEGNAKYCPATANRLAELESM